MLYQKDNLIAISKSPHSLGVQNNLTVPSPGFDENPLIIGEKRALAAGLQGCSGLGCLGLGSSQWSVVEYLAIAIGGWWVYKYLKSKRIV